MEEKPKVKLKRGEPRDTQNWLPYILIGIGVLFLLSNFGIIAGLFRLWPLILIGVGVMFLFGRTGSAPVKRTHFEAPLDNADSARVRLNLSVGRNRVSAVSAPDKLIEADITHVGDVEFAVTGEQEKMVSLSQSSAFHMEWLNPATWFNNEKELRWDVGLSPNVPVDLDVNGGVGETRLDLSSLHLSHLEVGGGVGAIDLSLPNNGDYDGYLKIGVGSFKITVPSGANANLQVKGGVGECIVNVPADAAVRVQAHMGVGEINMPARITRISGDDGDFVSKRGVWETSNFVSADRQIVIDFEGGVGEFSVR
jgi:hypothetical protein